MGMLFKKGGPNVARRAPHTARAASGGSKTLGSTKPLGPAQQNAHRQPCLRPATPTKKRTPSESAPSTPLIDDGESALNLSVRSEYNDRDSRLARLARRNPTKALSTRELEEMRVEEKRREIQEMMRKNEMNRRKALHGPDQSCAGRTNKPIKVTTPRAFDLSEPPTPTTRSREPGVMGTPDLSVGELSVDYSVDECQLPASLRKKTGTPSDNGRKTPSKTNWKPQLTVPKEPNFATAGRRLSRSESRGRREQEEVSVGRAASNERSVGRAASSERSVGRAASSERTRRASPRGSRESTPERKHLDVYAAAARLERRAAVADTATTTRAAVISANRAPVVSPPVAVVVSTGASVAAAPSAKGTSSAQERAHRARVAVQQKKEEEARVAQEKWHGVFKGQTASLVEDAAAGGERRARTMVRPPQEWDEAGEMSVRSSRSIQSDGPVKRPGFGSASGRPCLER